jgi:expansin (peptidoglycan-binding protein)
MRLALLALAACSSTSPPGASASPAPALGETQEGIATYYDADGSGNCSFDRSSDLDVAAMNAEEYAGSAACGQCVEVTGPKGKVTVRIVDQCPECKKGHLDLSREAFAKIAEMSAGRVPITWKAAPCNVSGPLQYRFKEGSSQWWTAVQVRNHRLPIAKLEWKKNGAFMEVKRESYNYFVEPTGMGAGEITLRVTASTGESVEDTLPAVADGQVVSGSAALAEKIDLR